MTVLVQFERVTLRYGYRLVLRDLDLVLEAGQGYLILGPNGSGKTTLLKAIAGLLRPGAGRIRWFLDAGDLGWLTHEAAVYADWSAARYYRWMRDAFFPHRSAAGPPADPVLQRFWNEPLRTYSRGMRQRFFLHLLDAWQPRLVCLDEPLTGLDAEAQRWCRDLLKRWQERGQTLVVTSHQALDLPAFHVARITGSHLAWQATGAGNGSGHMVK